MLSEPRLWRVAAEPTARAHAGTPLPHVDTVCGQHKRSHCDPETQRLLQLCTSMWPAIRESGGENQSYTNSLVAFSLSWFCRLTGFSWVVLLVGSSGSVALSRRQRGLEASEVPRQIVTQGSLLSASGHGASSLHPVSLCVPMCEPRHSSCSPQVATQGVRELRRGSCQVVSVWSQQSPLCHRLSAEQCQATL